MREGPLGQADLSQAHPEQNVAWSLVPCVAEGRGQPVTAQQVVTEVMSFGLLGPSASFSKLSFLCLFREPGSICCQDLLWGNGLLPRVTG